MSSQRRHPHRAWDGRAGVAVGSGLDRFYHGNPLQLRLRVTAKSTLGTAV